MNLLALGLLVTSLLLFAAFHGLPGFDYEAGWQVWPEVAEAAVDPELFSDPGTVAILASFLMLTALIVASPFLVVAFRQSRLAWWLATLMSGLSMFAFWLLIDPEMIGTGGGCLLLAPVFHFLGMLMIRGRAGGTVPGGSPDHPAV